ncbi:hypothetical protein PQR75_24605 [Paraburkholderia fungorum]|jgi:hypothetical protein|uniref:hypothetical protein n=1 Tax=Paraburkholderia fungorum TaxID=134537 RepID=UPI0038B6F0A3
MDNTTKLSFRNKASNIARQFAAAVADSDLIEVGRGGKSRYPSGACDTEPVLAFHQMVLDGMFDDRA